MLVAVSFCCSIGSLTLFQLSIMEEAGIDRKMQHRGQPQGCFTVWAGTAAIWPSHFR